MACALDPPQVQIPRKCKGFGPSGLLALSGVDTVLYEGSHEDKLGDPASGRSGA